MVMVGYSRHTHQHSNTNCKSRNLDFNNIKEKWKDFAYIYTDGAKSEDFVSGAS